MRRRRLCAALILFALFPPIPGSEAHGEIWRRSADRGAAVPKASPKAGAAPGASSRARFFARRRLALAVRHCLGKPYAYGARGPAAFDCSGLVQWLYRMAGLRLPRTALAQGRGGRRAGPGLVFGDVLLFRSRASPSGWHCGMYLAGGYFVHAAGRDRGVIVSALAPRRSALVAARRYLA